MNDKVKARTGVVLANFFFGTSVVAVKHITPSLIQPFALTAVRIVCATLLFWMMYAVKPARTGILKKDYFILFFCAIMGIVVNQTCTMQGFALTSPVHASLLLLTTPITITLLAAWFLKESLNGFKIAGLFLGVCGGALLMFSRDLSSTAGEQQWLGDVFVIISAIGYSVYVIAVKPLMSKYKAIHILQWIFLFAVFFSLPIGWSSLKEVQWQLFDVLSWFALVYVVLGATFFAYQLMNYGISKLGAGATASYIYTQPFFAAVASMVLLHEQLSLPKIGAAALIMTGVFLTNYKKKAATAADSPIVSEHG